MEFFERIYYIISICLGFFEFIMIYRFIYGFAIDKIKRLLPYFELVLLFIMLITSKSRYFFEAAIICFVMLWIILLFINAKRHKLRHIFWLIPVFFTVALPIELIDLFVGVVFQYDLLNSDSLLINIILDCISIIMIVVIIVVDRKWNFSKKIGPSERFILCITSIFVCIVAMQLMDTERFGLFQYSTSIRVVAFLGLIMLVVIMIRMIMKGITAQYYIELNAINEKNMENLLAHFEAYKIAQEDTKKLRHDMKNHIACMRILQDEEKYEELKEYLEELCKVSDEITFDIQVGNDIVDAILNEKSHLAQKDNIVFRVNGDIARIKYIKPIDWCIIFANAVDNAVEALLKIESNEKKELVINIVNKNNHVIINIENNCLNKIDRIENKIQTTKSNSDYHGYGLENIKTTVKKYQGDIDIQCGLIEGSYQFKLIILLPIINQQYLQ